MPFDAIKYVTSGISLVAFLATISALVFRLHTRHRERLIQSASEKERPALVLAVLESFNLDTPSLTKEQRYNLAVCTLANQAQRSKHRFSLLLGVFILFLSISVAAIFLSALGPRRDVFVNHPMTNAAPIYPVFDEQIARPSIEGAETIDGNTRVTPMGKRLDLKTRTWVWVKVKEGRHKGMEGWMDPNWLQTR